MSIVPRTTLTTDKQLLAELQRARSTKQPKTRSLPRGKNMGRELVNIADRNALYDILDRDSSFPMSPKPPRP